MIKNYTILLIIMLLLAGIVTISEAYEVVAVKGADLKPYNEAVEGFKKTCDCNVIELSLSEEHVSDIIRIIRIMNPDGVFAVGLDALAGTAQIKDLPLVYALVSEPEKAIQGKDNISGVSMVFSPFVQLSTIHELFPQARRIGIIYDPGNTGVFVQGAKRAAAEMGIELVLKSAKVSTDVPRLLDSMLGEIDVYWMLPDITVVHPEAVRYMLLFSFRNKVPVFSFAKKYVEMGALAALNIAPIDIGAQAGDVMRSVVNENVNGSPIRIDARKADLIINKKVARKMGFKIRDEILARAEDVGH